MDRYSRGTEDQVWWRGLCLGAKRGREPFLYREKESLPGSAANSPERKTRLQREINAADRQIDRLVYELYGLTEDEIKIVENADRL